MINQHNTVQEIIDWWLLHGTEVEKKVAAALEEAWDDVATLSQYQCECADY